MTKLDDDGKDDEEDTLEVPVFVRKTCEYTFNTRNLSSSDEEAIARYWWSLPLGSVLPLTNGDAYQLLFAGLPGGAAGPDVRAAVLYQYLASSAFT